MPQIRVLLGYQQGQVFSLGNRVLVVGRDPNADIVLHPDSAASRRHAEVVLLNGNWSLRDLGSANGTILNGRPVREERLTDQDEMEIGDNVFVFENTDPEVSQIAEAATHTVRVESRGFQNRPEVQGLVRAMGERMKLIEAAVSKVVVGQEEIVRGVMTAILSREHAVLRGVPKVERNALFRVFGEVLELKSKRFQFMPGMMARDVVGMDILERNEQTGKKECKFLEGPIFTNLFFADEINRAPSKTRAALFEAMQEYGVTTAEGFHSIEPPFLVLATEDRQEQEETAPLPEAQIDRFMFCLESKTPAKPQETMAKATAAVSKVLTAKQILSLQAAVRDVPVSDCVMKYAVRLVLASRPGGDAAPDFIKKYMHAGANARAAQYLILGAKAWAVTGGRLLVTPEDLRSVAKPVLRHRIFINFTAESEGLDGDQIVQKLIETVEEPSEF